MGAAMRIARAVMMMRLRLENVEGRMMIVLIDSCRLKN